MKNIFYILLLLLPLSTLSAKNPQTIFNTAKEAYENNNFEKALENYLEIEKQNIESFELYYNIGNCYYKLNQIAKSIQYYSKSLKLNPKNADAKSNLKFAYLKTVDKIEPQEELFLNRWWKSLYNTTTSNNWAWFSFVALCFFCALATLFLIAKKEIKRKLFFFFSVLFFLITIIGLLFSYNQYKFSSESTEGVIANFSVSIKSAPTESATNLFVLHEGTVVQIIETNQNWLRVQLNNEKEGWVNVADIVLI